MEQKQSLFTSTKLLTENDLKTLILQVEQVNSHLFTTKYSVKQVMDQHISSEFLTDVKDYLMSFVGSLEDSQKVQAGLSKLRDDLLSREVVVLEVAKELKNENYLSISKWLEMNLRKPHILRIVVKAELLGGAIINFQGKFGDYSLIKKISSDFN